MIAFFFTACRNSIFGQNLLNNSVLNNDVGRLPAGLPSNVVAAHTLSVLKQLYYNQKFTKHTLSLEHTQTHSNTHTISLSNTQALSFTHKHALSLSLTHTHTHTFINTYKYRHMRSKIIYLFHTNFGIEKIMESVTIGWFEIL